MATIEEQLEALTLRDNFNRANESPMVSANWTKLSWCQTTGKVDTNAWTPSTGFTTKEDGAYWNPASFSNPAVIGEEWQSASFKDRWSALWAALNPATENGYRLKLVVLTEGGEVEWRIERVAAGVPTLLKSGKFNIPDVGEGVSSELSFALTVLAGKVTAWKRPKGGEWAELGNAEDATYTEGRVAVEGRGFGVNRWDAFYADELESEGGEEEGVHKPNSASATASVVAPEISHPMQPGPASATADIPSGVDLVGGASLSATERETKGLPLPFPSVLANPGRLGPPRFTSAERKTLRIDRNG